MRQLFPSWENVRRVHTFGEEQHTLARRILLVPIFDSARYRHARSHKLHPDEYDARYKQACDAVYKYLPRNLLSTPEGVLFFSDSSQSRPSQELRLLIRRLCNMDAFLFLADEQQQKHVPHFVPRLVAYDPATSKHYEIVCDPKRPMMKLC